MKRLLLLPLALAATPAFAHVGADGTAHHFYAGFSHPFSGLDHCAAMVAIGLLAAFLGGRMRMGLPAAFLGAMLTGFALGAGKVVMLPAYEAMIVASVIGLGLVLLVARRLPPALMLAMAALFGLAHGFAHGIEGALTPGYAGGFLVATALLHASGLLLGSLVGAFDRPILYRFSGAGLAALGLALALN
jgi:urease accessory protein